MQWDKMTRNRVRQMMHFLLLCLLFTISANRCRISVSRILSS